MPTGKGRYNPAEDYAYDPADMTPDVGEELGQYQDPVNHARAYIKATGGSDSPARTRQETALANRQAMRASQTGPAPVSGGAKVAEHLRVLDDIIKQQ